MNLKGGCHCGKIRYEVKDATAKGYYCHCQMCRLSFGNVFAAFINIKQKNVKWLRSKPKYFKSSKLARRGFCASCGTPLSFQFNDSENMDISVGSLDQPGKIKPTWHFGYEGGLKNWRPKDKLKKIKFGEYSQLLDKWKKYYGNKKPGLSATQKR